MWWQRILARFGRSRRAKPQDRRRSLGWRSEHVARRLLAAEGYRIIASNVRAAGAELDVIAEEGQTLCFIEVRSTTASAWGGALASIGPDKQHRVMRAAEAYIARLVVPPSAVRFDVIGLEWRGSRVIHRELVRGAFDANGPCAADPAATR